MWTSLTKSGQSRNPKSCSPANAELAEHAESCIALRALRVLRCTLFFSLSRTPINRVATKPRHHKEDLVLLRVVVSSRFAFDGDR